MKNCLSKAPPQNKSHILRMKNLMIHYLFLASVILSYFGVWLLVFHHLISQIFQTILSIPVPETRTL
jgi:hypothetical protein